MLVFLLSGNSQAFYSILSFIGLTPRLRTTQILNYYYFIANDWEGDDESSQKRTRRKKFFF